MDKESYKPRILMVVVIALVIGQFFTVNYLKSQIDQCYDATNMNTILQGALVNVLVERNIVDRQELINEAKKYSEDLKLLIEQVEEQGIIGSDAEPKSPVVP